MLYLTSAIFQSIYSKLKSLKLERRNERREAEQREADGLSVWNSKFDIERSK